MSRRASIPLTSPALPAGPRVPVLDLLHTNLPLYKATLLLTGAQASSGTEHLLRLDHTGTYISASGSYLPIYQSFPPDVNQLRSEWSIARREERIGGLTDTRWWGVRHLVPPLPPPRDSTTRYPGPPCGYFLGLCGYWTSWLAARWRRRLARCTCVCSKDCHISNTSSYALVNKTRLVHLTTY